MNQPMTVIELIYSFEVGDKGGGIERFAIELCRHLDRRQFTAGLGALFDRGAAVEQEWLKRLSAEGLVAFQASAWDEKHPYRSFWRSFRALWRWQSQHRAALIHSHSEFSDVAALLLKFHPSRPKVVRTVHYGFQREWRKRPLRRLLLTNILYPLLFDLEIGVSQAITAKLNQRPLAKVRRQPAVCIYNAIDLKRFENVRPDCAAKRASLNIPPQALLIGSVGRLTEQKGYTYLVEAAAAVAAALPQAFFLIVGGGELEAALKDQANHRGLSNRLIFSGPRTDIEEILACLDLFVSSSLWEGLPTVILESMASGIPIVATDIPGTGELLRHGQNAWLAPPANAPALAEAILAAVGDSASRKQFSQMNRQAVQAYSIQAVADRYAELYTYLHSPLHHTSSR